MAAKSSISAITLTSIAGTALTTSYKPVNSTGLSRSCSIIRLSNNTSKDLTVSYDGITDHEFVKAGTILQISLQSNKEVSSGVCQLKKGTVIYVKSDAAGTGIAYLSGYYQER